MRKRENGGARSVDDFLAQVPPEHRTLLRNLRRTIRGAAPDAEEVISYGMPAFRYHGMLVYYAAFRDHCSFFVGGPKARLKFAEELKPFSAGKATIHFTRERPLPAPLVRRIVQARVAENLSRAPPGRRMGAARTKAK